LWWHFDQGYFLSIDDILNSNQNHSKLSRSSWINAEPSIFKDELVPTEKLRYYLTLIHVGLCCMPGSAVTNLIHN
jgi:hypothetical protein